MTHFKIIIVSGNVVDGFMFYGPYDTSDEAIEAAEKSTLEGDWWIAKLWMNIND